MKRFLSILLVAVMLLGMLPATSLTAFAADTQIEFALGTDGTASHADGSGATTYTEAVGEYTLSITGGTNMYTGARDAKGNGCIKLGTSSKAGSFSFTVPDDVTSVVIYVAAYKANAASITINNGTATALTSKSNDGAYDAITVDTTSTKTVNLAVSSGYRAMVNTITYVIAGGTDEPACTHEGTTERQNVVIGDCTTDSYSGDLVCTVCGKTVENGETTTAPGHTYVDGVCSACGAAEPTGSYEKVALADIAATDVVVVTMTTSAGVTYAMSNNNGTSSAPAATVVTVVGDKITSEVADVLLWNIANADGNLIIYPNGTTETWLYCTNSNNGVRVGTGDADVFVLDETFGYLKTTETTDVRYIGVYNNQDWRCYKLNNNALADNIKDQTLAFYKLTESTEEPDPEPACTHEGYDTYEDTDGKAASCTEDGQTATVRCSNCNEVVTASQPITATGHSYVDGVCSVCGAKEPIATLMTEAPKTNDVVIIYNVDGYAMSATASGKKLSGITVSAADSKLSYTEEMAQLTVMVVEEGVYAFVNNEKFLTSGDTGSSLSFADTLTDCGKWTLEAVADTEGVYYIKNVGAAYNGNYNQALEYYSGFTTYGVNTTTAYQMQFYFVKAIICEHPTSTKQDDAIAPTCVNVGYSASEKCDKCGVVTKTPEEVSATGVHIYENNACTMCHKADPASTLTAPLMTALPKNGDVIIIYNYSSGYAMSATANGKKLSGIASEPANSILPYNDYVALLTVEIDENGYYSFVCDGKYLTSGATGNNLYFAEANGDYAKWTVGVAEEGLSWYIANVNAAYEGNAQALEWYSGFTTYTQKETDVYKMQLYCAKAAPVAEVNGTEYTSIDAAIAEIAANGGTLKLLAPVDSITYTDNLYLDLNGYSVASASVTGTIYASDSKATVTAPSGASLTTAGEVAIDNTANGVRYIALNTEGVYTFHVLDMKLSAVTLRTSQAGIYYKATVSCDPVLAAAATQHGIALSTRNMPGANFATEKEENGDVNGWTVNTTALVSGEEFTSGSVFGIFKQGLTNNAARGEVEIYANAYIMVGDTVIMADQDAGQTVDTEGFDGIAWSLKDVLVKLEETYTSDSLTDDQRTQIAGFYRDWASAMSGWGLTQIANAAANLPAE